MRDEYQFKQHNGRSWKINYHNALCFDVWCLTAILQTVHIQVMMCAKARLLAVFLSNTSRTCVPSSSSETSWFHGRMKKCQAEHLLRESTPGSFLVRKQDSSRFYISVATSDGVIHHPVKLLGQQYYYTGKAYSSLESLVSLFMEQGGEPIAANLFPSENSLYSDENGSSRFIVRSAFNGIQSNEGISVFPGDIVTLLENRTSELAKVRNHRTGSTGLVPWSLLISLFDDMDDIAKAPYVHSSDLSDALEQMRISPGSFLLRPSSRGEDCWAILVNMGNEQVKKFLIREAHDQNGGWILAGRRFKSIPHVIDRYCHFPILDDVKLCHAILSDDSTYDTFSLTPESDSPIDELPDVDYPIALINNAQQDKNKSVVATTVAMRKSKEEKPWKPCYISLHDDPQGCQLIVADDSQLLKVRGTYKLPFCVLYNFDDSVFDKDGCFYLSQDDVNSPGIYLCIQPFHVFAEWICLLRPRVQALNPENLPIFNGFQFDMPEAPRLSLLRVHLDKFMSDALKTENVYSAQLTLNGIKVCSTPLLSPTSGRGTPTVVFDSSFLIPFSPCVNASAQVTIGVLQKGKHVRPFGISPVIPVPTSDLTKFSFNSGVSMRMSRSKIIVLGEKEYSPVLEWLESGPTEVLEFVSDNLSAQDRSLFTLAIVCQLYSQPQKLLNFIEALLVPVISNSAAENVLRQDSLVTSVISQTLRIAARMPLEKGLEKLVPSTKLPESCDVQSVVNFIVDLCQSGIVPDVLATIKRVAVMRFCEEPHVVRRVLSNVLILRFVNPIILARLSGVTNGQVIAKGVQTAANSACTKIQDPDEPTPVNSLRRFFEEIPTTTTSQVSSNQPSSYDWLAICCHLLYTVIVSRPQEIISFIPENIERTLLAHKSQD